MVGLLLPVLAGCASSAPAIDAPSPRMALSNGDLQNSRNVTSAISASTIADLRPLWSTPLEARAKGLRYIASPVVQGGVAYIQDPRSNVFAVDIDDGRVLWQKRYEEGVNGPNGVIVVHGRVFGATHSSAFALDVKSGRELWLTSLTRNSREQIAMSPGYHDGRVYLSTASGRNEGDEVGVLWALDARSGRTIWHFDTVPRGLWGRPNLNGGGGVDFAPAFDGEGSMYVAVNGANPIPGTPRFPWGSSRPGPNLFTDSIVKLDEKTGKVRWYYQVLPHGVCAGEMSAPVLADVDGRKVVIGAGLFGIVVALDANDGHLIWRRPVGVHNGHDNDGLLAMRGEYRRLKTPTIAYPGLYGGVFGLMSLHGSTLFVPLANGAARVRSQSTIEPVGTYTGELVALDVGTGSLKWKKHLPVPLLGPTTVTNSLVFTEAMDGTVQALDVNTGQVAWSKQLPLRAEGGMAIADDELLVRAGYPALGKTPKLLAYRLSG